MEEMNISPINHVPVYKSHLQYYFISIPSGIHIILHQSSDEFLIVIVFDNRVTHQKIREPAQLPQGCKLYNWTGLYYIDYIS